MLRSGLVKQVVGSDRRVRFIELTPKGIATLEQRLELLHGSGWQR
jgi:DNA-binding MarR family transcriptional regulator